MVPAANFLNIFVDKHGYMTPKWTSYTRLASAHNRVPFDLFPAFWKLYFLTCIVVTFSPHYGMAIWRGWLFLSVTSWNKFTIVKWQPNFSSNFIQCNLDKGELSVLENKSLISGVSLIFCIYLISGFGLFCFGNTGSNWDQIKKIYLISEFLITGSLLSGLHCIYIYI